MHALNSLASKASQKILAILPLENLFFSLENLMHYFEFFVLARSYSNCISSNMLSLEVVKHTSLRPFRDSG